MTRARFRPPAWAVVLAAAATAAFCSLGAWQLRRGLAKERVLASLEAHAVPEIALGAGSPPPDVLVPQPARARGRYLADRQLLEDGQSRDGVPGYHVWTPLQLGGGLVLVDRGWVPRPPPALATPAGEVEIHGLWRRLPEPALRLRGATACPERKQFPLVVLFPQPEDLECLLGAPVAPGLLLLDPRTPGGYVREWSLVGFPPARHYGYAVQWFGLAAVTVFLFVKLNLRRSP